MEEGEVHFGGKLAKESILAKKIEPLIPEFDYIIINDDFDTALNELGSIVCSNKLRKEKQMLRHKALFEALLHEK